MMSLSLHHGLSGRRQAVLIAPVIAALALLGLASTALAKEPTGDFAVFNQCPRFTTGVNFCLYSETTSGEVAIGKSTVPIKNTIVLQGGYIRNNETGHETFVGAINGETLSKTPQSVSREPCVAPRYCRLRFANPYPAGCRRT